MTNISDYIHLYVSCNFIVEAMPGSNEWYLGSVGFVTEDGFCGGGRSSSVTYDTEWETSKEKGYLILRDPANLPPEIRDKYYLLCKKIKCGCGKNIINVDTPESLRYAFSRGIDCFDLIEKGLAIEESDLKNFKILTE